MTLVIMILLIVVCQIFDMAIEYDEVSDKHQNSLWHKFIRNLARWISKEEIHHA